MQPKDNGTELILKNSGFKEVENFAIFNAMSAGWQANIQKIADKLNANNGTTNA